MIECSNLILAIGQTSDLDCIKDTDLTTTKWGTFDADEETLVTNHNGIFAGGDAVLGPANVVTAIAHGKRAAISIDQYLRGEEVKKDYQVKRPAVNVEAVELTDEDIAKLDRPAMPCMSCEERTRGFDEVELGLGEDLAVLEAKRCLRCDNE